MFKKNKKIKTKARLRTTRVDDDDATADTFDKSESITVVDGNDDSSTMGAILHAKKKRKLLQSMQFKRGIDAALTLQSAASSSVNGAVGLSSASAANNQPEMPKEKNLEERLRGTFSGGTGGDFSSGDGVMERKHMSAMEEFIQQKLDSTSEEKTTTTTTTIRDKVIEDEASTAEKQPSTVRALEQKLYAELATSAQAMAGKPEKEQSTAAEGDVGSGGAMLGGTGIAEVTLPVDDRLKTAAETAAATSSNGGRAAHPIPTTSTKPDAAAVVVAAQLPMSFAVGKGKRRNKNESASLSVPMMTVVAPVSTSESTLQSSSSANLGTASSAGYEVLGSDVSGVGSSYSHNFRQHAEEWLQNKKESERLPENAEEKNAEEMSATMNHGRIGFEAARRGGARGGDDGEVIRGSKVSSSDNGQATERRNRRSNDDRVYKKFMTKQKEQRGRR